MKFQRHYHNTRAGTYFKKSFSCQTVNNFSHGSASYPRFFGITEETGSGKVVTFACQAVLSIVFKAIQQKSPTWLLDPLGPLATHPISLPIVILWLYQYWSASRKPKQPHTIEAKIGMMELAKKQTLTLIEAAALESYLGTIGHL